MQAARLKLFPYDVQKNLGALVGIEAANAPGNKDLIIHEARVQKLFFRIVRTRIMYNTNPGKNGVPITLGSLTLWHLMAIHKGAGGRPVRPDLGVGPCNIPLWSRNDSLPTKSR